MNFSELRFLTDENIHPLVVSWLRNQKYDVVTVYERNLNGNPDLLILEKAAGEKRVVLTHDADFGKIIFTQTISFTGIIFLRPGHINFQHTIDTINFIRDLNWSFVPPFIWVVENQKGEFYLRVRNNLPGRL